MYVCLYVCMNVLILLQAETREEVLFGLSMPQANRGQSLTFIFNVHDYELSIGMTTWKLYDIMSWCYFRLSDISSFSEEDF